MARFNRSILADMRAMEKQTRREVLRPGMIPSNMPLVGRQGSLASMEGGGAMVGGGATPSMGLSQFRGGGHSSDGIYKMEGGALIRLNMVEESPGVYRAPKEPTWYDDVTHGIFTASETQLTQYHPPDALVNGEPPIYGTRTSTALDTYDPIFAATQARMAAEHAAVGKPPAALGQLTKIALAALAIGAPIAALAGILSAVNQGASAPPLTTAPSETTTSPRPTVPPVISPRPTLPVVSKNPTRGGPGKGLPVGPSGSPLSPNHLAWYLQTGNLPQNYYESAPVSRHRGGAKVDGRSARAEIVRKVMSEKGMKMIEASKYVKAHGLY